MAITFLVFLPLHWWEPVTGLQHCCSQSTHQGWGANFTFFFASGLTHWKPFRCKYAVCNPFLLNLLRVGLCKRKFAIQNFLENICIFLYIYYVRAYSRCFSVCSSLYVSDPSVEPRPVPWLQRLITHFTPSNGAEPFRTASIPIWNDHPRGIKINYAAIKSLVPPPPAMMPAHYSHSPCRTTVWTSCSREVIIFEGFKR